MANKPRSQVKHEMEIIEELMYGKPNLSDKEIINQLQINDRTFRRYRNRIEEKNVKIWEKEAQDRSRRAHARLNMKLEYLARETKKIIDDNHNKPSERIEAIKTLDILEAQIATLAREGPVFRAQLPNKVVKIDSTEQEVAV